MGSSYTIYYRVVDGAGNVVFAEQSVTAEISRKQATLDAIIIPNQEYTGSQIKPDVTVVTTDNETLQKGTDYTVTYGDNRDVDYSGSVTISPVPSSGYNFKKKTVTFNITPKSVDTSNLAWTADEITYNGSEQSVSLIEPLPEGVVMEGSYIGNTGTDVGTYSASVAVKAGDTNHAVTQETIIHQWKIIPKPITPTVTEISPMEYTGGQLMPDVIVQVGSDTLILDRDYTVTYGANINVADGGTVTIKAKEGSNYTFTSKTVTFNISPKPVNTSGVTLTNDSLPYNGSEQSVTAANVPEHVTASISGGKGTYVGEYTATVTLTPDTNHSVSEGSKALTWNITAVENPASVTAAENVIVANSLDLRTLVSNYQDAALSFTITEGEGTIGPDGYTYTAPTTVPAPATVTAHVTIADKDLDNDGKTEYTGKTGTITLTIVEKQAANVTGMADQTVTYGESYSFNAQCDQTGEIRYTYKQAGTVLDAKPENVGTYTVTAIYDSATHHGEAEATLTIAPATITGSISQKGTLTYNKGAQTASVTNTLKPANGQDITVKYGTESGTCNLNAAPGFTDAGEHSVYFTATAPNHNDLNGSFTVTIGQAEIDVSGWKWDYSAAFGYTGDPKTVSLLDQNTNTGFELVTVEYTDYSQIAAGTYTATAGAEPRDSKNYKITGQIPDLNWEITKASYDMTGVKFADAELVYNGSVQHPVISGQLPTGLDGKAVTVTYEGGIADVGTSTVTAKFATDSQNYNVPAAMTAKLTITAAPMTSVTVPAIKAPAVGKAPQTEIPDNGSNWSAAITWTPAIKDGKFDFNTVYTAHVTLKPDGNHSFTGDTLASTGLDGAKLNADGTITGAKTYDATRKAQIQSVTAPENQNVKSITAEAVMAELPKTVTITAEDGTTSLPLTWEIVGTYDPAPKAQNTFKWTAEPGDLVENGQSLTGTIQTTNLGNVLQTEDPAITSQSGAWVDGIYVPVTKTPNGTYLVLPGDNCRSLVTYTYNSAGGDPHSQYPTGMQVWLLKKVDGLYQATRAQELDNLLSYAGCSIRLKGVNGIRMITSVDKGIKSTLIHQGYAGCKLVEYGTVVAWTENLGGQDPVLGGAGCKSNYAYKKGVADPIFRNAGSKIQYTNVLVGFSMEDCRKELSLRPYILLEDENGQQIPIYGGTVQRSIGYIAYQNRNAFPKGSPESNFVWNIINNAYSKPVE